MVCSSCRDKLAPAGKCHVCGIATSSYHRCDALERLVESICVPCPNAAHGCNTKPAYYDHHGHCKTCPYAPYRCPSKECSFVGSTEALLDHFTGAHPPPRLVGLRGTASASMTASTSSLLTVLTTTIMEALPPPSAAVNTCSS